MSSITYLLKKLTCTFEGGSLFMSSHLNARRKQMASKVNRTTGDHVASLNLGMGGACVTETLHHEDRFDIHMTPGPVVGYQLTQGQIMDFLEKILSDKGEIQTDSLSNVPDNCTWVMRIGNYRVCITPTDGTYFILASLGYKECLNPIGPMNFRDILLCLNNALCAFHKPLVRAACQQSVRGLSP